MTTKPWTDTENAAAVALYFTMRKAVDEGRPYNKAAMIRELRGERRPRPARVNVPLAIWGDLSERSRHSIEAKLMNVTAVLHDLGRDDVSMAEHGYRPLSNYQSNLKTIVIGLLAVRDEAVNGGFDVPASA